MALHMAMTALLEAMTELEQTMDDVLWAVEQGQPEGDGHALADRFESGARDLLAGVREAREAAFKSCEALNAGGIYEEALRLVIPALLLCQDRVQTAQERYWMELATVDALQNLETLARERARIWGPWVRGLKDALGPCGPALSDAARRLLPCWRELATPVTRPPIIAHLVTAAGRSRQGALPT